MRRDIAGDVECPGKQEPGWISFDEPDQKKTYRADNQTMGDTVSLKNVAREEG